MNRDMSSEKSNLLVILPAILVYIGMGLVVTLLAAYLLAVLISSGAIAAFGKSLTALCCVPGTFLTGFLTARRASRRRLPMGAISGGLFLILMCLISIIFLRHLEAWSGFWFIFSGCIGGSVAGALCAIGIKKR